MSSGPRLLFLCNDTPYFLRHWRERAQAASAAGFDVTVALPESVPEEAIGSLRVAVYPLRRATLNPLSLAKSLERIWRLARRLRPNIVHSATVKPNLLNGMVTTWLVRTPAVLSVTGLGSVFTEAGWRYAIARRLVLACYRRFGRRTDLVFTVDNRDDAEFLGAAGVAPRSRLEIMSGAGVDPAEFEVGPEDPTPPLRVVLPARMLWSKGVGVFVEAARRLQERGLSIRMQLVGAPDPGSRESVPRTQLERWRAEGLVEWAGFSADMRATLRQANVVTLPTLYREGLPRALIEAALAGRPLIATDVPGCREIVRPGETGLLVPPNDAVALADAIERLALNPSIREALAGAARELARERYTREVVVERTLGIYRTLAGNPRADAAPLGPSRAEKRLTEVA
jgi:glycosyltransferase involved in cell wall biosynthesis